MSTHPSASEPGAPRKRSVATIVYLLAGIYLLIAVLAIAGVEFLLAVGYGWSTIVLSGVFFALARFVQKGSRVALAIAIVLFVLEGVTSALVITSLSGRVPIGLVVVRLLVVLQMAVGFLVMKKPQPEAGSES